ncbi:hypothetical protein RHSIM_RhsimUnG0092200 [Rhododendron simsii]|uniref:F-box domain-containing protein n=1 Tax=Rhododendron simsii TaxID=118357 RepID=A0A834FYM3_RHOSS|nr:hypothetical protein RHSIM_RhsimUnG0092200 [Rhododendron simsii]
MKSSRKKTKPITHRTPPGTSPAAELIANNIDLLTPILLRLPAKSLIRFKGVSKHWLSLLSDSRFASTHLNPKPLVSSLYFYYNGKLDSISLNGSPAFPTLSFLSRRFTGHFTILHSCNGLLLIENPQITDDCVEARYIVCNPTTQKYTVLSQPGGGYYASGCLAFDPSKSPHYKVVFVSPTLSPSLHMDIFSSETTNWKKIFLVDRCDVDGAFWKGNLYWLYGRYGLWRFHVETDKVVEIPYEEIGSRILSPDKTRYFGECGRGGRLFLIQSYSRSAVGFKIREMGCCCWWNVKFRVNLRALISAFPEIRSRNDKITVMCVVEGEKEDDLSLILAIPGKVISYNLQKKTWTVLRDLASEPWNNLKVEEVGISNGLSSEVPCRVVAVVVSLPGVELQLTSFVPNVLADDTVRWSTSPTGIYSVQSAWNASRPSAPEVDWHKVIWYKHHIPRCSIIQWWYFLGRLATKDTLHIWGFVDSTDCAL